MVDITRQVAAEKENVEKALVNLRDAVSISSILIQHKDPKGLTINNLNKFLVRHFKDQALSGLKPNPRFHEDKFR